VVTPLPSPLFGEERPVNRRFLQDFSFLGSFLCGHLRRSAHLERLSAFVNGQQIGDEFG
jgi:hypothetical protein